MNEPIRILHVIGKMGRGGAETMIMNIYRQIDRNKIQFDFAVHTENKEAYDDEIISMGGKIYKFSKFMGMNIYNYTHEWKQFLKEHNEYKIIHGHIGSCASVYLQIAKKNGIVTIAHSHNTKSSEKSLKSIFYPIFTYPTRYISDYFFGCSEKAGIDRYGKKVVSSGKFKVLNNAILINEFIYAEDVRNKMRKKLNIQENFVIGHIGRFSHQKNHELLIDIFKVVHDINKMTVLLLVGDGELHNTIEKKVKNLGLSDSVIFSGVRSDAHDLLQAMDVFVFPSIYEGLGIVTIEAQAAGLPCIVSDVIPKEADVTDLIKKISLKEPLDVWVENIIKFSNGYKRRNTYKEIKNAGYDIYDMVKQIEGFYLSCRGGS